MFGFLKKIFQGNPLIAELKQRYRLEERTHPHPMISGSGVPMAWMGSVSGMEFSFRFLHRWELIVGELFPIIDFALTRTKPGQKQMPMTAADSHVQVIYPEGMLAEQFRMTMIGHHNPDYLGPQLNYSGVQSALLGFSQTVQSVAFYKRGIQLSINPAGLQWNFIDQDLNYAARIAKELQARHSLERVATAHNSQGTVRK